MDMTIKSVPPVEEFLIYIIPYPMPDKTPAHMAASILSPVNSGKRGDTVSIIREVMIIDLMELKKKSFPRNLQQIMAIGTLSTIDDTPIGILNR